MIEYEEGQKEETPIEEYGVKVIGVGGSGANVLDRMALEGSDEAELLTLNTDMRALSTSVSSEKIQLGATLLKGIGTGGDPELGKQAALEAVDEIRNAVRGNKMVFVCVGLGGGTGSGAAPEICRIAKEEGVFLAVFATLPFSFEGERRMSQALTALETIGRYANAVVTFENDRMGELIVPKDGVAQAFAAADKIISQSIRATINVVYRPGIIRIGMDDLLSALDSKDSRCLFGYGMAKGESRGLEAVEKALKCPLLDKGKLLNDARSVLVQVAGGDTMTLYEVQLVMGEVAKHVGPKTQILFGTGTDTRLGNNLSVTVLSSISGPDPHGDDDEEDSEEEEPISLGSVEGEEYSAASPLASAASSEEAELASGTDAGDEEGDSSGDEGAAPPPMGDAGSSPFEDATEEASGPPVFDEGDEEEMTNPIARAMEGKQSPPPLSPGEQAGSGLPPSPGMGGKSPFDPVEGAPGDDVGRVEAETDSSQTIALSPIVAGGKTGRIQTRDPKEAGDEDSPEGEPTPPPASGQGDAPDSKSAKVTQQQLQLDPAEGAEKGRFAKSDPTVVEGEDLDIPTFLRKKK